VINSEILARSVFRLSPRVYERAVLIGITHEIIGIKIPMNKAIRHASDPGRGLI
jgi:hypothetical protein